MAGSAPDDAMLVEMGLTEKEYLAALKRIEAQTIRSAKRNESSFVTSNQKVGNSFKAATTQALALGRAIPALAVTAGLTALGAGVRGVVGQMADLQNEAARAGLSVTAFQELQFVSEQSRISLDAVIDGFKELQLRADEFIVTGKGSAAEAFERLGYEATDLKRRLEEPEELFLDIVDRMEDLDRAAQIRIADEVFGGTGGERFVELLSQGDEGIREMMDRAHELGLVIEEETVAKAAELDRKFAEITQRISTLSKTIVVDLAGAIEDVLTIDVDDIFGSAERAIAMLGEDQYNAMKGVTEVTEEQADSLRQLRDEYARLGDEAVRLFPTLDQTIIALGALGYSDAADAIRAARNEMSDLDTGLKDGTVSAEDFEGGMRDAMTAASQALAEIDAIDQSTFSNVISQIGALARALATAAANARDVRLSMPGSQVGSTPAPEGEVDFQLPPTATAPTTSLRPQMPGVDFSFGVPESKSGAGGGGGGRGGGSSIDDYRREVERTREEISRLEAEAVALAAVAETGFEYGDAVDYARKKAELLYEAQAAGKEITPAMRAEIDELALGYIRAGEAADDAADKLKQIEENSERGAEVMTDLFMSIFDGSKTAGEALRELLLQMVQIQLQQRMLSAAGSSGGVFGFIGSLFGGARAAGGTVSAGRSYTVGENGPEKFVPAVNGRILNTRQAQSALSGGGGAGGGFQFEQQIINQAGVKVRTEEEALPGGGRRQRLIISETVNEAMTTPGGAANRTLQNRGVRPPRPVR